MAKRRKLAEDPVAAEFIAGDAAPKAKPRASKPAPKRPKKTAEMDDRPIVNLTVRIPADLHDELADLSHERKKLRVKPATKQAIVLAGIRAIIDKLK